MPRRFRKPGRHLPMRLENIVAFGECLACLKASPMQAGRVQRSSPHLVTRRAGTLLLSITLLACGPERPQWSGPLAAVTDSVSVSVNLNCRPLDFSGQFGEFRYAKPPFLHCVGRRADTAFVIVSGAAGRIVYVSRSWKASGGQAPDYDRLLAVLSADLGPGRLCPQSDDLAVRDNRGWAGAGYHLGIAKIDSAELGLSYSLGPIDCHGV